MDTTFDARSADAYLDADACADVNANAEAAADLDLATENTLDQARPVVGPNCSINSFDRHEIERLKEELEDLQRWFEQYGEQGILFPNSIINAFPTTHLQAA